VSCIYCNCGGTRTTYKRMETVVRSIWRDFDDFQGIVIIQLCTSLCDDFLRLRSKSTLGYVGRRFIFVDGIGTSSSAHVFLGYRGDITSSGLGQVLHDIDERIAETRKTISSPISLCFIGILWGCGFFNGAGAIEKCLYRHGSGLVRQHRDIVTVSLRTFFLASIFDGSHDAVLPVPLIGNGFVLFQSNYVHVLKIRQLRPVSGLLANSTATRYQHLQIHRTFFPLASRLLSEQWR
jgi:hypothetical protein